MIDRTDRRLAYIVFPSLRAARRSQLVSAFPLDQTAKVSAVIEDPFTINGPTIGVATLPPHLHVATISSAGWHSSFPSFAQTQ
jgi:hypothetical protein